jgi:hypothetical protein
MDTLAHKALERGQATPACQRPSSRLWPGDEDDAHAASTELHQDRSRSDEGVAARAGAHRNLRRRRRLALSLHERGPEA